MCLIAHFGWELLHFSHTPAPLALLPCKTGCCTHTHTHHTPPPPHSCLLAQPTQHLPLAPLPLPAHSLAMTLAMPLHCVSPCFPSLAYHAGPHTQFVAGTGLSTSSCIYHLATLHLHLCSYIWIVHTCRTHFFLPLHPTNPLPVPHATHPVVEWHILQFAIVPGRRLYLILLLPLVHCLCLPTTLQLPAPYPGLPPPYYGLFWPHCTYSYLQHQAFCITLSGGRHPHICGLGMPRPDYKHYSFLLWVTRHPLLICIPTLPHLTTTGRTRTSLAHPAPLPFDSLQEDTL